MADKCEQKGWLKRLYCMWKSTDAIQDRVEQMDKRNREVKHDLNNIAFRADALRRMVMRMREDETWRNNSNS
jgi:hypothetical protein